MGILLAVGAALGWGTADFLGGRAARATPVFVIVALSELGGGLLLIPVLLARGVALPANGQVWLACVAGVAVTIELGLIYVALSRGEAFVTAPVGALGAAIAVAAGLIGGDPLDAAIGAGLLCALVGGGVSAWTSEGSNGGRAALRGAAICVGAAAAVATMLASFHAAGRVDPYWATALEHASTTLSAGLFAFVLRHRSPRWQLPGRGQLWALALVAMAGAGGDLAYAAAGRHGDLSIVSAVSSLYPVTTVALGAMIQGARPGRLQAVGIALALVGAAVLGAATS